MPHHNNPRLRILSVGGNAISAFLSWRLSATNACDVTLVWKSGYESVAQYGISFRSSKFGNERFKPRQVVRSPEEAAQTQKGSYDYVLLCVKALPDVYDLASVIEPVVTPQHTCILINTTHSLGVEALIEERFPQNVVLSLVSSADIQQLGPAEFEHDGPTELWVGPANLNPEIPASIQSDMAAALAMTLSTGQVDCHASKNIQQQQFERMIGPVVFHTSSVLFETPNHAELLELTGVRELISDGIEEMLRLAETRGCSFPLMYKERVMEEMIIPKEANSIMYQDYTSRRPMEVETYLGSPLKIAKESGVKVPRIETLYAILHHINTINQKRPTQPSPGAVVNGGPPPPIAAQPPTPGSRAPSTNGYPPPGPMMNGNGPLPMRPGPGRNYRAPSMTNGPPPSGMRRGPPPGMNGYAPNGMPPNGHLRGPPPMQRRPSPDGDALDEFSHVVLYDNPGDTFDGGSGLGYGGPSPPSDIAIRERELMLRQKELALRERELAMGAPMGRPVGRGMPPRAQAPPSHMGDFDEEDGEDDYFDPMAYRGPPVNPENVDMMSITSRRNRKQPSRSDVRRNPEHDGPSNRRSGPFGKLPGLGRNRASSQMTAMNTQALHEPIADNPLLGYSSDRYGVADRSNIAREGRDSRAGSLTTARLNELSRGPGYSVGYPPANRRTSHSPGHPLSPSGPGAPYGSNGMAPSGRPSPPNVRQPTPRHPPGHGNSVAPQQVESRAGVSNLYPPAKSGPSQVRSLTGSASASAGSGDSNRSAHVSAETSAYSSQSSIGPRPPIGVR